MPSHRWWIGPVVAAAALALLPASAGARQQAGASPAEYAGEDTCLSCHPNQSYKGTAHALATNARTPAATQGCESCHGPGKPHVDGGGDASKIVNPATVPVPQGRDVCGKCHDRGTHPPAAASAPDPREAGCSTCHSVHSPKRAKLLKRERAGL